MLSSYPFKYSALMVKGKNGIDIKENKRIIQWKQTFWFEGEEKSIV